MAIVEIFISIRLVWIQAMVLTSVSGFSCCEAVSVVVDRSWLAARFLLGMYRAAVERIVSLAGDRCRVPRPAIGIVTGGMQET